MYFVLITFLGNPKTKVNCRNVVFLHLTSCQVLAIYPNKLYK